MFKIGNIEIKGKVVLGPMAGVTSLAYRDFMKPFGVALSVTEMVSASGIIYDNQKTFEYIKTSSLDHPVAIQLFDSDEHKIVKAMEIISKSGVEFEMLDINLGCPVPKVTDAGAGSKLLKDPKRLYEYMAFVVENSPKPVTAKIRLGWDNNSINVIENVKVLEKAGVAAIAIHARTAKQMYEGQPDYEAIRNLRDSMNIPLIVSGNIFSLEDAKKAVEITHADAVMVARGGIGNPNLIKQINDYFEAGKFVEPLLIKDNIKLMLQYVDMLIKEKGEFRAMKIARGIIPKFFNSYPNTKQIKNEIAQNIVTKNDLLTILKNHDLI